MARMLDKGSQNPRVQCAVCGRWMRLRTRTGDYRFHGGCSFTGGDHAAAKPDTQEVCADCCEVACREAVAAHKI